MLNVTIMVAEPGSRGRQLMRTIVSSSSGHSVCYAKDEYAFFEIAIHKKTFDLPHKSKVFHNRGDPHESQNLAVCSIHWVVGFLDRRFLFV